MGTCRHLQQCAFLYQVRTSTQSVPHMSPNTINIQPLTDPRGAGRGHGPLAAWASTQNALKVVIFTLKIEKIFWGGGNAPFPDPS